jgi:predicted adenylyl cyclase CyaB
MKFEVEKKARLKSPAAMEKKLAEKGRFEGTFVKEDRYYLLRPAGKRRIDMKRDPIFRIRIMEGRCWLGAKKRTFRGKTEINEEVEIPLGHPREALWFLETYLGLEPFVRKRKSTRLYRVGSARVEINKVDGLGHFLEVEVQKKRLGKRDEKAALDRIDSIFRELGVDESDVEPRYYIDLLLNR